MPGKSDEKRPLREEGAAPSDASQFVTPVAGMTPLETALGGTERSPTEAPAGTVETAAPVLGGRSDRVEKLTVTHKSSLKQTSKIENEQSISTLTIETNMLLKIATASVSALRDVRKHRPLDSSSTWMLASSPPQTKT